MQLWGKPGTYYYVLAVTLLPEEYYLCTITEEIYKRFILSVLAFVVLSWSTTGLEPDSMALTVNSQNSSASSHQVAASLICMVLRCHAILTVHSRDLHLLVVGN